jgi:hypothetical protein
MKRFSNKDPIGVGKLLEMNEESRIYEVLIPPKEAHEKLGRR